MKKILYSCIGVIDGVENNIVHARISEDFENPDFDTFVTFNLDQISLSDQKILQEGSIFYAHTSNEGCEIRLRRLIRQL
jgi:hypothetical protein